MDTYFGCKPPKKDLRDYKVAATIKEYNFPNEFILENLPKVKNQKNISSCVAHSISSILEYHDRSVHNLSTNFIYGIQNKLFDRDEEGMYISEACKIAKNYGDMLETDCPGNNEIPDCYKIAENAFADEEKLKRSKAHIIESYFKCSTNEDIKYALQTYGPVIASVKWMGNWSFKKDGTLVEDTTNKEPKGYHAIMIVGWNENGFICQNSWGKDFGNEGRFILPYRIKIEEAKGIKDSSVTDENIVVPKRNAFLDFIYKILNWILNKIS